MVDSLVSKITIGLLAILLLVGGYFAMQDEPVGAPTPTKQQVFQTLQSQNWILTEEQKPLFRDFLRTYTVETTDLPYLRQIVLANDYDIDKIKDSALFAKIMADIDTVKVEDAVSVLDTEDTLSLKQSKFKKYQAKLPVTVTRGAYQLQILELDKIDGGIQVFARAWKDGEQIGFGVDGTVDIERFRIFNPPVLVFDANGDIERKYVDETTGEVTYYYLREDPREALLRSLADTIKVVNNKHDSSNIIEGKRGNTTSTFYSTTGDGRVYWVDPSWTTAHDSAAGETSRNAEATSGVYTRLTGGQYVLSRGFYAFDTSLIGSDSISASTFTVTQAISIAANSDFTLSEANQASVSSLSTGDFDECGESLANGWSSAESTDIIEGASRVTVTTATGNGDTQSFTLDATGRGFINTGGYTKLCLRDEHDIDDNPPASGVSYEVSWYWSDNTGTTNDPKLVVEHAAGGGGGGTVNRVAPIFFH